MVQFPLTGSGQAAALMVPDRSGRGGSSGAPCIIYESDINYKLTGLANNGKLSISAGRLHDSFHHGWLRGTMPPDLIATFDLALSSSLAEESRAI